MSSTDSIKRIKKLYDKRIESKNGVKAAGQWGSKELIPFICEEICSKISIKNEHKILELGCGSGVLGSWINLRCSHYVGLDLSSKMLNFFLKEADVERKPHLLQGITNMLPFLDDIFDVVTINGVTMYLNEERILKQTLNEMKRVAKKNALLFLGENIITSELAWEFVWFQNLAPIFQPLAKQYIKFRKWLAKKNPKLGGKWRYIYQDVSPDFIKNYFGESTNVTQSNSAAYTVRQKIKGKNYKGNKRVDFVIKLS